MRPRQDPAWFDAQYNNRANVPEHPAIFARWAAASAAARAASNAQYDIAYGSGAGETLDLYLPPAAGAGAGAAPVLVYIHGGYWRALDKADFSFVAPSFNADGVLVVVPNYALAPAVSVEHIALQMTAAVAWTWRNAARYGGDPGRIVVAGHSAGGHLVSMLLSCRWKQVGEDLPAQLLNGGLSISGVYDLEPIRQAPFLQVDLKLTPASVRRLSPAFFPRPRCPLYTVAGGDESEEFIRQNRLIRDVWGPTAVPICETVAGKNHMTVLEGLADPAGRLHDLALRLLGLR
jgi:arylformamidase